MSARKKDKLAEEISVSDGGLREMVNKMTTTRATDRHEVEEMEGVQHAEDVGDCPITDKDEKPFDLMKLPAEIRNEIYRACLTRPFNVLLSKKEPPPVEIKAKEDDEDSAAVTFVTGDNLQPSPRVPHGSRGFAAVNAALSSNSTNAPPRAWASRGTRPVRLAANRSTRPSASSNNNNSSSGSNTANNARHIRPTSHQIRIASGPAMKPRPREPRPQDVDPLIVNLLRVSKTVYQEARSVLYSENLFTLDLDTALATLAMLHQRSRRQIKHVEVEIPCYNEILERFQETVRLSLRYCWGLKKFVIFMPFTLPGADGSGTTGNTTVYANGFDILRWLPKQCEVVLKGNVCSEIEAVVSRNANLAKTLDEVSLAARQND